MLDLAGLCDRANDKVQGYSMGMKQRLGIAAALLSDPSCCCSTSRQRSRPGRHRGHARHPAGARIAGQDGLRLEPSPGEIQVMADVVGIIRAESWSARVR